LKGIGATWVDEGEKEGLGGSPSPKENGKMTWDKKEDPEDRVHIAGKSVLSHDSSEKE